jgi:hypothetical protein
LDFLDNVIIRLCRLFSTGLPSLVVQPGAQRCRH